MNAEWLEYDRTLDAAGRIVRGQQVRRTRTPTTHAFKSWPADSLATHGWVVERNDETSFYAPDADVLLSDSFAAAHCFRVEPAPPGGGDLVGVGFEPAHSVRHIADIEGTFWLDRATAELRTLEFRYTGLPKAASDAAAGGRVEFLRLGAGNWLVNRWHVLMPFLSAPAMVSTRRIALATPGAIVRQIQVSGGVVTSVTRDGVVLHTEPMPVVTRQVVGPDPLVKAAGAIVTLAGSDYESIANEAGLARFENVLPGRYRAEIRTAVTEGLGLLPMEREVDARLNKSRVDSLVLPSGRELLRMLCGMDAIYNGQAQVYGFVRDSLGRGAPQAAVTVSWLGSVSGLGSGMITTQSRVGGTRPYVSTLTNDLGMWHTCGVPRGLTLLARSETDSGEGDSTVLVEGESGLGAVDINLRRRGTRAVHDSATVLPALLEIRVTDATGGPVPGAVVEVRPSAGDNRRATTNDHGLALVANLEPGIIQLSFRRLGFKPGDIAVTAAGGRNTVSLRLDANRLPTLDTVRVKGSRNVTSRLDEFETRRLRHEATASITRDDILKRNPVDSWQMLTNVPSVKIVATGFLVTAQSARGKTPTLIGDPSKPCYLQVMIDGIPVQPMKEGGPDKVVDLSAYLPPPSDIHGMEVFAGPASIPLKYGGAGSDKWCGLIAIWTRDR